MHLLPLSSQSWWQCYESSGLICGFTSRTSTRCPIVFGTPQIIRAKSGQEREDKGGGRCKQASRHASAPSAPTVFLSTVSVLLCAGRRSLRSSRVCLSWLSKVQDKRHAVVLSFFSFFFFPRPCVWRAGSQNRRRIVSHGFIFQRTHTAKWQANESLCQVVLIHCEDWGTERVIVTFTLTKKKIIGGWWTKLDNDGCGGARYS